MTLATLFEEFCELLSGDYPIERHAKAELQRAMTEAVSLPEPTILTTPFLGVMNRDDAHPVCDLIGELPFCRAPPQTSPDLLFRRTAPRRLATNVLYQFIGSVFAANGFLCSVTGPDQN